MWISGNSRRSAVDDSAVAVQLRELLRSLQNSDAARIFDDEELEVIERAAKTIERLVIDSDTAAQLVEFYRTANHKLGSMLILSRDVGLTVIGALERRRREAIEAGGVH